MQRVIVIGSLNLDYSIETPRLPAPGETILARGLRLTPGGKGANQAYALARLGCAVRMVGAVGADSAGETLRASLRAAGVDDGGVRVLPDAPTGQAFIPVDERGENSILVVPGANSLLTRADVDRELDHIAACDAVVLQLEIPLDVAAYAAARARALGKLVVLDPAPAVPELPDGLLACADFLKPNETELAILTGLPADTEAERVAAAQSLLARGVGTVLVSQGGAGVLAVDARGVARCPAVPVRAVDTTAAGDCFTAAFVAAYDGANRDAAIGFAVRAAAIAVSRPGAQSSIPTRAEVEAAP